MNAVFDPDLAKLFWALCLYGMVIIIGFAAGLTIMVFLANRRDERNIDWFIVYQDEATKKESEDKNG